MTLEHGIGAALVLLFLADIFLTVLYARAGTGLLAPYWNRAIWAGLHAVAKLLGERRRGLLSLAGPIIIVTMIVFWAAGLTLGAAMIIQPELGTAITPSSGQTSRDFGTALFVAGNSLSIVGGGDYSPHTSATRFLFLVNSLIGASVLSLVLSYLVQVYSALRERNALALEVDLMTDETGDAAIMLARLIPRGDATDTASQLGNLARALAAVKEAHHFYPLLFYFRFSEPRYAVSRFGFILLISPRLSTPRSTGTATARSCNPHRSHRCGGARRCCSKPWTRTSRRWAIVPATPRPSGACGRAMARRQRRWPAAASPPDRMGRTRIWPSACAGSRWSPGWRRRLATP